MCPKIRSCFCTNPTKKGRAFFTCETRETFGVHMQTDQAICSRCIGTALPSLHSRFVSVFAFIFFRVLLGATLNAERSVACSDLSSLHSYFSTGIVLLMSPLHNRCHVSVRLRAVRNLRGFSGYDCNTGQGTDVGNSIFRQAFDTLSKARQGRVGRTNGAIDPNVA